MFSSKSPVEPSKLVKPTRPLESRGVNLRKYKFRSTVLKMTHCLDDELPVRVDDDSDSILMVIQISMESFS